MKNLEIEKKFILTPVQKEKLLEDAEFISEKNFTDAYYDNKEFSLALNDMWLRKRDGEFNLKIPMRQKEGEMINKYQELDGEMAIREIFAIPVVSDFETDLASLGHGPFCIFKTVRKKYSKDGFVIDLDKAYFEDKEGKWEYELAEIELVVSNEDEMEQAEKKIYEFASRFDLEIKHVNGKLLQFIKKKLPDLYGNLIKTGVAYEDK